MNLKALRPGTKSITSCVTSGKTNKPGTSASFVRVVVRIKKDQGMRCLAVVRARTRKELKLCGHAMFQKLPGPASHGQFLFSPSPPPRAQERFELGHGGESGEVGGGAEVICFHPYIWRVADRRSG